MTPPLYPIETVHEQGEEEDDLSIYDPRHARAYGNMLQEAKKDLRRQKALEASEREGLTPPPSRLLQGTHKRAGFNIPCLRPLPEGTRYAPTYGPRSELEKEIGGRLPIPRVGEPQLLTTMREKAGLGSSGSGSGSGSGGSGMGSGVGGGDVEGGGSASSSASYVKGGGGGKTKTKHVPAPWFPVAAGGEAKLPGVEMKMKNKDGDKLKLPTMGPARVTTVDPTVSKHTKHHLETKTMLKDAAELGTMGTNNAVWHWTDTSAAGVVSATVAGLQEQAAAVERRRRRWKEREWEQQQRDQRERQRRPRDSTASSSRGDSRSVRGSRGGSRGGARAGDSRGGGQGSSRRRKNVSRGGGGGGGGDSAFAAYARADSDAPARVTTLGNLLAEKTAREKKNKIGVSTRPRLLTVPEPSPPSAKIIAAVPGEQRSRSPGVPEHVQRQQQQQQQQQDEQRRHHVPLSMRRMLYDTENKLNALESDMARYRRATAAASSAIAAAQPKPKVKTIGPVTVLEVSGGGGGELGYGYDDDDDDDEEMGHTPSKLHEPPTTLPVPAVSAAAKGGASGSPASYREKMVKSFRPFHAPAKTGALLWVAPPRHLKAPKRLVPGKDLPTSSSVVAKPGSSERIAADNQLKHIETVLLYLHRQGVGLHDQDEQNTGGDGDDEIGGGGWGGAGVGVGNLAAVSPEGISPRPSGPEVAPRSHLNGPGVEEEKGEEEEEEEEEETASADVKEEEEKEEEDPELKAAIERAKATSAAMAKVGVTGVSETKAKAIAEKLEKEEAAAVAAAAEEARREAARAAEEARAERRRAKAEAIAARQVRVAAAAENSLAATRALAAEVSGAMRVDFGPNLVGPVGRAHYQAAVVLDNIGRLTSAVAHYERFLAAAVKADDVRCIALAHCCIAVAKHRLADADGSSSSSSSSGSGSGSGSGSSSLVESAGGSVGRVATLERARDLLPGPPSASSSGEAARGGARGGSRGGSRGGGVGAGGLVGSRGSVGVGSLGDGGSRVSSGRADTPLLGIVALPSEVWGSGGGGGAAPFLPKQVSTSRQILYEAAHSHYATSLAVVSSRMTSSPSDADRSFAAAVAVAVATNMGHMARALGDDTAARGCYERAAAVFAGAASEIDDQAAEAACLGNILVLKILRGVPNTVERLRELASIHERMGDTHGHATALVVMGTELAARGDELNAVRCLQAGNVLAKASKNERAGTLARKILERVTKHALPGRSAAAAAAAPPATSSIAVPEVPPSSTVPTRFGRAEALSI